MKIAVAIACGGALGALLRYWLSTIVYEWFGRSFPIGTLTVNVVGSALMGFLWIAFADRLEPNSALRAALLIGLLGAFTTFSTFSIETLALMQAGQHARAALNIGLSVVLCVGACAAGMSIARIV